ncbi:hypothetical protein CGRA01v4_03351 [Colletotrichum graminicola]|nr:hypothetical protein CGRA01v4_03351 [Colletotrichum graminicola]
MLLRMLFCPSSSVPTFFSLSFFLFFFFIFFSFHLFPPRSTSRTSGRDTPPLPFAFSSPGWNTSLSAYLHHLARTNAAQPHVGSWKVTHDTIVRSRPFSPSHTHTHTLSHSA